jgi:hypothetical protein
MGAPVYVIRGNIVCELVGINPSSVDNPLHFWSKYIILTGRDAKTFQVVTLKGEHGMVYVKDKNGVYFDDKKLLGVDPATFIVSYPTDSTSTTPAYYWKDKNHAYFISYGTTTPISDNPSSFENMGNFYARDDKNVFFMAEKISGADPLTFKILTNVPDCYTGKWYAKDKANVYYGGGNIVQGADPTTFISLGYGFGKDNGRIYQDGIASTTSLSAIQSELHCWYYNGKLGE